MAASSRKATESSRRAVSGKRGSQGKRTAKRAGKAGQAEAKAASGRREKQELESKESFFRSEVAILVSFAAAILLFLSNFHLCGAAGDFLRGIQLGMFGTMGYVLPLLLFGGTCFYLANQKNPAAWRKLAAAGGEFFILCTAFQLFLGGTAGTEGIFSFYQASQSGFGGGLAGGLISMGLRSVFGTAGTLLVLLVASVIGAVFITERSFVRAVRQRSSAAYRSAREDMDRRREEKQQRQNGRSVRGVNLGATDLFRGLGGQEEEEEEEADWNLGNRGPDCRGEDREEEPNLAGPDLAVGGERRPRPEDAAAFAPEELENWAEADKEQPACGDDVFTGSIYPQQEDSAPFDEEEEIFMDPASASSQERIFSIPQEEKRVVTASGKVIETDTEAMQKRLEEKRKEVQNGQEQEIGRQIQAEKQEPKREYIVPPLNLLKKGSRPVNSHLQGEYRETAVKLQQTLRNFGVGVTVTNISCGPSVTRYELHPEQGVKVSKIVSLADDIKLSLAAEDIRIEAPIPGKSAVGIEVPNKENNTVFLRELLESEAFRNHPSRLAFAVGKDIGGQVVVTDIAKMPHLLIAGATGSGKSVCINTLIMSIIYKSKPEEVRLIMVDPKVVELSVYNGIPHLLIPVVTDPKKASGALNWAVAEMTDRYKKFAQYNVRDLKGYNGKVDSLKDLQGEKKPEKLPQIVIIVDELADLMMVAPGEVEDAICRLAQLARACGIHLVIATQRPSVNVITGLIKANIPSRIAFSVSSGVDSRTIIDMNGAEKLLGKGDMLFYPAGFPKPQRVQGAFVSDQEVQQVVDFLTKQGLTASYSPDVESQLEAAPAAPGAGGGKNGRDEYFEQAGRFIIEKEKASIGMLQRMFKIGFNRAARIMDQLAEAGVVGEEEGTKPRKVLMTMEEFEALMRRGE